PPRVHLEDDAVVHQHVAQDASEGGQDVRFAHDRPTPRRMKVWRGWYLATGSRQRCSPAAWAPVIDSNPRLRKRSPMTPLRPLGTKRADSACEPFARACSTAMFIASSSS